MDEFTERELNRKYHETFCAVVNKCNPEDKWVVRVRNITGGWIGVKEACLPSGEVQPKQFPLNEYKLLQAPSSRVFNRDGRVWSYRHLPERQWSLGVKETNAELRDVMLSAVKWHDGTLFATKESTNPFNLLHAWDLVDLFFPSPAKTISVAIARVKGNKSIAETINKNWFLSVAEGKESFLLWFNELAIAHINNKTKKLQILNPLFKQEVNDLLRRIGDFYYE